MKSIIICWIFKRWKYFNNFW